MKTAVFLGRFQPFHIGHLSIVEKILKEYDRLIIVIGSSQESGTDKNPWTVQEREQIIRASIPIELQERIDIAGLEDVPDDDEWGENLKNLIQDFSNNEKGKIQNTKKLIQNSPSSATAEEGVGGVENSKKMIDSTPPTGRVGSRSPTANLAMTDSIAVFTGNEWVRGICERHGIQTEWIDYTIKISGTEIREKLRRGEDVSKFVCTEIQI